MRRSLVLPLLLILLLPTLSKGQQEENPLVVSLANGGFASFKLEVSPLDLSSSSRKRSDIFSPPFTPRVVAGEDNVLHRMLIDEQGRLAFVYDLVIKHLESPKRFEVSARALDPAFAHALKAQAATAFQNAPGLHLPTLARDTERQTVADGETVALDLLINESLAVKVVDYVTVASERLMLSPTRPARSPRDFAIHNVELAIRNYQLYVDQEPVVTSRGLRNCTGALVWFSLPGRGRFIFSLVPYEGYDFRKIGVIEDNKISFSWKGINYEWVSKNSIVGSGGLWNLWVLHDQDYVDIFDQPVANTERKITDTGRIFPKPVGVSIPLPRRAESALLSSHQSKKQSVARVRVVIGGAKSIETLLPKK